MISLEEIKEKQEELNKMIEEYNKQDLKWDKNCKPKENENYYFINDEGNIHTNHWWNDEIDNYRRNNLRIFQTEEQAQKWLEIDTYLREKSFEPDWNNNNQRKYSLYYNYVDIRFYYDCNYFSSHFEPFYFESKEIIDEILEKYSIEELRFYFNIGE